MSSNAIARTDDTGTSLEVLPPARPAMSTARQVLMEHAEMANMAYDFATKLVGTRMVPARYRNQAEEATAAILYGAELGLGPIAALQNIFDVHGSPAIYARTAQALLEAKGYQFKTLEDTDTACAVAGWKPGRDPERHDANESSRFTFGEAERAGWVPKIQDGDRGGTVVNGVRYQTNANGKLAGNEKYLTQPRQMLWAKAMMEVCRRLSPATLLGIAYSVEELESEPPTQALSASPPTVPATDTLTVEEILAATPDKQPEQQAAPAVAGNPRGHTSRVEAALAKAHVAAAAKKAQPDQEPPEEPEQPVPPGNQPYVEAAATAATAFPVVDPTAVPEDDQDDLEPTPDPSEPDPTGDYQPPPLDMGDDPGVDADEPPAPAPGPVRDGRPATKEQLKELTELIAAAGFQPTDEGRIQWFAFVSQTVGRDITANNQLTRDEIGLVGKELVMPAPSAPDSQP